MIFYTLTIIAFFASADKLINDDLINYKIHFPFFEKSLYYYLVKGYNQ